MGKVHPALAAIAERQHGIVTRAQLAEAGVAERTLDRTIARGGLVRLHAGVYAVAGSPDTFLRRSFAATLAAGPSAAASHRAAAHLHGLVDVRPRLEVSLASGRPRLRGVLVHRVVLPSRHVELMNGLRVTSVARTLCDLPSFLGRAALVVAIDGAVARRRLSLVALERTLDELPSNKLGVAELREIIAERPDGRARVESVLEGELQAFLGREGIAGWVPQLLAGSRRLDVAFPESRLALEADSFRHHSSRSDWERDHARNGDLIAAGWRVLHVTRRDLRDRPAALAQRIRAALDVHRPQVAGNVQSG